jgi:myotubularin-related protein 5/13
VLDELDLVVPTSTPAPTDAKTLERLSERSYVRDWCRLGLCPDSPSSSAATSGSNNRQRSEQFRLSTANHAYMLCRR